MSKNDALGSNMDSILNITAHVVGIRSQVTNENSLGSHMDSLVDDTDDVVIRIVWLVIWIVWRVIRILMIHTDSLVNITNW